MTLVRDQGRSGSGYCYGSGAGFGGGEGSVPVTVPVPVKGRFRGSTGVGAEKFCKGDQAKSENFRFSSGSGKGVSSGFGGALYETLPTLPVTKGVTKGDQCKFLHSGKWPYFLTLC